jgi:hypothetical protein
MTETPDPDQASTDQASTQIDRPEPPIWVYGVYASLAAIVVLAVLGSLR